MTPTASCPSRTPSAIAGGPTPAPDAQATGSLRALFKGKKSDGREIRQALMKCISGHTLDFNKLPHHLASVPLSLSADAWTALNEHTRIEVVMLPETMRSHELPLMYPGLNRLSHLRVLQIHMRAGEALKTLEGLDLREERRSPERCPALHIRVIRDEKPVLSPVPAVDRKCTADPLPMRQPRLSDKHSWLVDHPSGAYLLRKGQEPQPCGPSSTR